jgi:hypothetical protein
MAYSFRTVVAFASDFTASSSEYYIYRTADSSYSISTAMTNQSAAYERFNDRSYYRYGSDALYGTEFVGEAMRDCLSASDRVIVTNTGLVALFNSSSTVIVYDMLCQGASMAISAVSVGMSSFSFEDGCALPKSFICASSNGSSVSFPENIFLSRPAQGDMRFSSEMDLDGYNSLSIGDDGFYSGFYYNGLTHIPTSEMILSPRKEYFIRASGLASGSSISFSFALVDNSGTAVEGGYSTASSAIAASSDGTAVLLEHIPFYSYYSSASGASEYMKVTVSGSGLPSSFYLEVR